MLLSVKCLEGTASRLCLLSVHLVTEICTIGASSTTCSDLTGGGGASANPARHTPALSGAAADDQDDQDLYYLNLLL